eukprot:3302954-Rhodomonas_salina.1
MSYAHRRTDLVRGVRRIEAVRSEPKLASYFKSADYNALPYVPMHSALTSLCTPPVSRTHTRTCFVRAVPELLCTPV